MTARNAFRGPGAYNLDVSLSKTFPIHEKVNFELRAEGFNVTNHHNLYIRGATLDVAQSASSSFIQNLAPVSAANSQVPGSPYLSGVEYPILAAKGGIGNNGGANDERRFLQFAGKINF